MVLRVDLRGTPLLEHVPAPASVAHAGVSMIVAVLGEVGPEDLVELGDDLVPDTVLLT